MNNITVVVCSNNLDKAIKSAFKDTGLCRVVKFLLILDKNTKNLTRKKVSEMEMVGEVIQSDETGLSKLRNIALQKVKTKYILFIDDDVELTEHALHLISKKLEGGCGVVGMRLKTDNNRNLLRWYLTENQFHYLTVHAQGNTASIWGACMAFNLEKVRKENLKFQADLGRINNSLLSGEDTSFIQSLVKKGATRELIDYYLIHNIDRSRLSFSWLCRRVFSQGVTESMRSNIIKGFIKEVKRNFSIKSTHKVIVGVIWINVFLLGVTRGFLIGSRKKKQLLFICTGNYYRSRYAEIYFNYKMKKTKWSAVSVGLDISNPNNKGGISPHTKSRLEEEKISFSKREPVEIKGSDFVKSDMVIAINREEHEKVIKDKFPEYADRVMYWDIKDVYELDQSVALSNLKKELDVLIKSLSVT